MPKRRSSRPDSFLKKLLGGAHPSGSGGFLGTPRPRGTDARRGTPCQIRIMCAVYAYTRDRALPLRRGRVRKPRPAGYLLIFCASPTRNGLYDLGLFAGTGVRDLRRLRRARLRRCLRPWHLLGDGHVRHLAGQAAATRAERSGEGLGRWAGAERRPRCLAEEGKYKKVSRATRPTYAL